MSQNCQNCQNCSKNYQKVKMLKGTKNPKLEKMSTKNENLAQNKKKCLHFAPKMAQICQNWSKNDQIVDFCQFKANFLKLHWQNLDSLFVNCDHCAVCCAVVSGRSLICDLSKGEFYLNKAEQNLD